MFGRLLNKRYGGGGEGQTSGAKCPLRRAVATTQKKKNCLWCSRLLRVGESLGRTIVSLYISYSHSFVLVNGTFMDQDDDLARNIRAHVRVVAKRDSYAAHIKGVRVMAQLPNDDLAIAHQLPVASAQVDDLWAKF
jgi:hypothetical protein